MKKLISFNLYRKNNKGLTLVELLVAMSLVGVVTLFLTSIYIGTIQLYRGQNLEISVVEAATQLNRVILQYTRQAEAVKDSVTDGTDTYTSGSNELVLQTPSLDGSAEPIPGVYDYYIFYQDGTDLRWKLIPDAQSSRQSFDHLAAEEITNMVISYDTALPPDANLITFEFTLEKEDAGNTISISRSTSVNMRNQ